MLSLLLLTTIIGVSVAHNWQRTFSRAAGASTANPALPRSNFAFPHVHVGKGQAFQVEWATGHGNNCYLVTVKAEDEAKLRPLTRQLLDVYLAEAPADQQGPPPPRFRKYARKSVDDDATPLHNGDTPNFFARALDNTTSGWLPRPLSSQRRFTDPPLMMEFKMSEMMSDRFARYTNPKWPFVLQVQRYSQPTRQAQRGDFALVEIPPDAPAGDYVVWYNWRGYYDITDVTYSPDLQVEDIYGLPGEPYYEKIDHCGFEVDNEKYPGDPSGRDNRFPTTILSNCIHVVTTPEQCLRGCDSNRPCQGGGRGLRSAVMVAPFKHPAGVAKHFQNVDILPWGHRAVVERENVTCDKAAFEQGLLERSFDPEKAFVCVEVRGRPASETYDPWSVTEDPSDPLYYSSCYIPRRSLIFKDLPTPPTRREVDWKAADQCLDCDEAAVNSDLNRFSLWTSARDGFDTSKPCVNCDTEPGRESAAFEVLPKVTATKISDGACEGITAGIRRWIGVSDETKALRIQNVGQVARASARRNATASYEEALMLIGREPRCSSTFVRYDWRPADRVVTVACLLKGQTCTPTSPRLFQGATLGVYTLDGDKAQMERDFKDLRVYQ